MQPEIQMTIYGDSNAGAYLQVRSDVGSAAVHLETYDGKSSYVELDMPLADFLRHIERFKIATRK